MRVPYLYKCEDDTCGKLFERKSPLTQRTCRKGLNCIRYDGVDVGLDGESEDYGLEDSSGSLDE